MTRFCVTLATVTVGGTVGDLNRRGVLMGFGDVAGIGALKDALAITNRNLELVLAELQETNRVRLETVSTELRQVNQTLTALIEQGASINVAG